MMRGRQWRRRLEESQEQYILHLRAIRFSRNFTITSGQWTAPGPIVVTNRDKAFIDANISFNTSNERESCGGTFTGSITYQVPVLNDEGVEEAQDWTATEGTVSYTVS